MNTTFQQHKEESTVEWYTPPYIIESLGKFDLDPCASHKSISINASARRYFTKEVDGLYRPWEGRVWLNPPYKKKIVDAFVKKLSEHNNGIALVYNRFDSRWFQDYVLKKAHSIFFFKDRIYFIREDGTVGNRPGSGSCLIAYGEENTEAILNSGLDGLLTILKIEIPKKK